MSVVSWNDSYSVGVERIDDEHKMLIALINKAYDSAQGDDDVEALKELTNDLRRYALMHFATETALMKDHDYPGADDHLEQHKIFISQITTAIHYDESGQIIPDTIRLIQFLAKWLLEHIPETDKELGKFLNEKGVS